MALVDLNDFDLFDLVLASNWPEEEQMKLMEQYMNLYQEVLTNALGSELKDEDEDALIQLMQDPNVTPESLMKFYTDRIPHMEAKIIYATLQFKKTFVLMVYKNKLEAYKNNADKHGLEAWEHLYKDAQEDNWNEVMRLINVMKETYSKVQPSSV